MEFLFFLLKSLGKSYLWYRLIITYELPNIILYQAAAFDFNKFIKRSVQEGVKYIIGQNEILIQGNPSDTWVLFHKS